MDHVLAKVKRQRKNPYRKVLSDCSLYENHYASMDGYPAYDSDHKLDEDSWFKFVDFSKTKYCLDLLKEDFDAKNFSTLERNQFSDMTFLCAVQGEDFYFQKLTPATYLCQKKVLHFGEAAVLENYTNRLIISSVPDAIYKKNTDTLIFKNLSTIASIFPEIDELYKEATQKQVTDFLKSNFIELAKEYGPDKVSKPNRKRVGLAIATLALMSDNDKEDILAYINEYCAQKIKFDVKKKSFNISTDEELKNLFYGIEQRFYTTPVGKVRRLANSVQSL